MRTAILANGFQTDYMINLVNSLVRNEVEVDFICSDFYLEQTIDSRVNILNLRGSHNEDVSKPEKVLRLFRYYFKLLKYLFNKDVKTVHIQWMRFYYIDGILFPRLMRLLGKNCVYTAHDVLPHDKETFINKILFKKIYKIQHEIVVHTDFIKNRLLNEFRIPEKKIHTIRHGVYEKEEDPAFSCELSRKELNIPQGKTVLLFFGIIAKYKGLQYLSEAFNKLDLSKFHLVIAGRVRDEYLEEYAVVKETLPKEHVSFFEGFVEDSLMEKLFRLSDIVVLPYSEASQSGVLFMAYAFNKPAVVPNLGGFPYDVNEPDTGCIFETQNSESLKQGIEKMSKHLENGEKYDIRKFARDNYSWDIAAKSLNKIY